MCTTNAQQSDSSRCPCVVRANDELGSSARFRILVVRDQRSLHEIRVAIPTVSVCGFKDETNALYKVQ